MALNWLDCFTPIPCVFVIMCQSAIHVTADATDTVPNRFKLHVSYNTTLGANLVAISLSTCLLGVEERYLIRWVQSVPLAETRHRINH